ncbi:uncharacterized protein LOC122794790 [Protopterus annectens]|uniref:uncharacterized protein LOC122794790 n=1 Tax=Protopterus annectens TaxID=7888 RepID=UPI001CFBE00B|nr:uncharacterized protein LOC122794790 [Protopterus annectens]
MADNLCEDFPITVYPVRNEFQHKTQENSWNHITWIVATVCIVFAVALVKSAICGNLKQQGVMLKNAIKNICFCGPSIFMLINRKSTTRKDEEYPLGVPEQCSPDEKPSSLHSSVGIHVQLTMTQSQDKTLEYIKDTTLECQDDTTLVYNSRTTVDYNSKTVTWEADSTTVNSQKEDDIPFPVQEAVKDKTTSWLTVIDTEKCPEPSSDEVPTAYWIPV